MLSFIMEGVHPHDVGTILDRRGHRRSRRPPLRPAGDGALRRARHVTRASLALYNTLKEEIDAPA